VIVITGIVQWLDTYPQVGHKHQYLLAFAIKMVGAIGLFLITFLLALPNERLKAMQRHRAFWAGINIICGLTILVGAALMRAVRNGQL
jgi:threonine/homoserine/homoserine lactone efflux protein